MTLIVITSSTDRSWVAALRSLRSRGINAVGIMLAGRTFGPAPDWQETLAELELSGLSAYLVRRGDDLTTVLAQPIGAGGPMGAARTAGGRPGPSGSTDVTA
jgi:hypothetical protein